jgi:hypothetical protein
MCATTDFNNDKTIMFLIGP